jgi:hypothetical protein
MHTLGIDLASDAANTASASCSGAGTAELRLGLAQTTTGCSSCTGRPTTGIDRLFGWSRPSRVPLQRLETDREALALDEAQRDDSAADRPMGPRMTGDGRSASPTWSPAALRRGLARMGVTDRSGDGRVYEIPAAVTVGFGHGLQRPKETDTRETGRECADKAVVARRDQRQTLVA